MKQLKLNNFLVTLLTMAALFAGQTAWAQTRELTLSEDNDFPSGTAGHWYVNMLRYYDQSLTLTEADLTACGYTFTARTTDYESRFKLVFVANDNENENENTPFAFINNGNIIVNGEGTLQIVDVLGRVLFSQENATVNYQLSSVNYASGVYILRLINGDNVKTQKIVVR